MSTTPSTDPLTSALTTPVDHAVRAASSAATSEAFTQAQALLAPRPETGTELDQWNVAVQVLAFRIEHASGLDALGAVVGLRRWGITWETIGRAAGISRQAAHTRWGSRVQAVLDRYGAGELGGPVARDEADLAG